MNKKLSLEKHICKCGNIMEHDGIEASIMCDENEDSKVVSDLDTYICDNCGYKIWIHTNEHSEII